MPAFELVWRNIYIFFFLLGFFPMRKTIFNNTSIAILPSTWQIIFEFKPCFMESFSYIFRCEILPGPQFILRRYHFLRNGKFHLTRFYYSDPWCSSAAFSVTVVGNFHPAAEKATSSSASWVVPGGLELDYTLKKMTLVPFTITEAITLSNKVNNSCPGIVIATWKPYKKYKVLNYEHNHARLVS